MSSILSFGMATSKKEKHSANSRVRRHSDGSHGKKKKKDKEGDTESVSSSSTDSAISEAKCPLRFVLSGLIEPDGEKDGQIKGGCPLRRVQLWHVIPLCLLAILNLLLVIVALLGLACYRIILGIQGFMVNIAKPDLDTDPYGESFGETDFRIITVTAGTEKLV
jgi:hypothetical protein